MRTTSYIALALVDCAELERICAHRTLRAVAYAWQSYARQLEAARDVARASYLADAWQSYAHAVRSATSLDAAEESRRINQYARADGVARAMLAAADRAVVMADTAVAREQYSSRAMSPSAAEQTEAWRGCRGDAVTVKGAPRSYVRPNTNTSDVRVMSATSRDMRPTTVGQLATAGHPDVMGGRGIRTRLQPVTVTPTTSSRPPSYQRRLAKRAAARGDSNVT